MPKILAKCEWAKVGQTAHAQKLHGPMAHAQKSDKLRMRKSLANCACAKVGPTAHVQRLGQLRMRKD
jgi:hypothetical protein